jgi:hypothetical protein
MHRLLIKAANIAHCLIFAVGLTACFALTPHARSQSVSVAQSDGAFFTTCPFSKGETVPRVKDFYGTASDPMKLEQPVPSLSSYVYHFQQYGVWIFFDDRLLIRGLRFDEPFAGKIGGVAIGDDQATVRRVRGEPSKQFAFGLNTAWTYNPPADGPSFLRYDFGATSGRVQSIFANSCHVEN